MKSNSVLFGALAASILAGVAILAPIAAQSGETGSSEVTCPDDEIKAGVVWSISSKGEVSARRADDGKPIGSPIPDPVGGSGWSLECWEHKVSRHNPADEIRKGVIVIRPIRPSCGPYHCHRIGPSIICHEYACVKAQ